MLRQDPVECLFQFICSQNNHISRIHGMVERLCAAYGTPLFTLDSSGAAAGASVAVAEAGGGQEQELAAAAKGAAASGAARGRKRPLREVQVSEEAAQQQAKAGAGAAAPGDAKASGACAAAVVEGDGDGGGCGDGDSSSGSAPSTPLAARAAQGSPLRPRNAKGAAAAAAPKAAAPATSPTADPAAAGVYYSFPTLDQLAAASEDELRALGFGYRAKFITNAVADLASRPGGGASWLLALRAAPAAEAAAALEELPGVGPKVAACVALFSLDKHDAIPVDTHVWQLATKCVVARGRASGWELGRGGVLGRFCS